MATTSAICGPRARGADLTLAPPASRYERLRRVVQRMEPEQLRRFAGTLEGDDLALLEEVVADMAAEVEQAAEGRVHWRANPARMACHFEPHLFKPHPYFLHLGEKFTQLADGTDPFQIWMVPAQHGKSAVASQYGPAWLLDRMPELRLLTVTYGDDLADRNGLAVRDILEEHGDVLRTSLRRDQRRKDRFLTNEGGGLLSAGMFSIGGGWSANGVVIDDPYKGWEQAHSAAQREKVWNIIRSVIWLRQASEDFWVLLCTTRWHEQDAAAQLVAQAELGVEFTVTRLAEIAEAPEPDSPDPTLRLADPIGREPGEILGRFSRQAVETKHALLGSYLTAGLAQQRPAPPEGTEILREWFQIEETLPPKPDQAVASWDLKGKDKETGDYVVGQLWWRVGGGYWLMDQLRGVWANDTAKVAMALMKVRHPEVAIQYFENAGNAPELTAELRRGDPAYVVRDVVRDRLGMTDAEASAVQRLIRRGLSSLVPVVPRGDKSVRMRAHASVLEGRNVHVPARAAVSWLAAYLEEMASFPNGSHDDQVDATSQALSKIARPATRARSAPEEGRLPPRRDAVPGQRPSLLSRGGPAR